MQRVSKELETPLYAIRRLRSRGHQSPLSGSELIHHLAPSVGCHEYVLEERPPPVGNLPPGLARDVAATLAAGEQTQ